MKGKSCAYGNLCIMKNNNKKEKNSNNKKENTYTFYVLK